MRLRPIRSAVVLGVCLTALRASAGSVAFIDPAATDPDVPPAIPGQIAAALRPALEPVFPLMTPAQLEDFRNAVPPPPDLAKATALLNQGKQLFLELRYKPAAKALKQARAELMPHLAELRDYQPLIDTLLYSGVVAMNTRDKKGAHAAFLELARIRPDFRVDPAQFPPDVLEAYEKARQSEVRIPRGRLAITSSPPGAKVYFDETPQAVTPLTLPAAPGSHVIRLELPGYLPWTEQVTVESYAKAEKSATLEKNAALDALHQLEAAISAGVAPATLLQDGAAAVTGMKVDGIITGAVGLAREGYMVSLVYLSKSGSAPVVAREFGRDLKDLGAGMAQMAKNLASAKAKLPTGGEARIIPRVLGDAPPTRPLDFKKFALGMTPGMTALALVPKVIQPAIDFSKIPQAPPPPPPSRWWVWTGLGVLAAAAAGGAAYYYYGKQPPETQFTLQREPAR